MEPSHDRRQSAAEEELPPPDSKEEFQQAFSQVKETVVPLWHSLVALAAAQAKYMKVLAAESVKIAVAGLAAGVHLYFFAAITWVFLNVGVWRVCAYLDPSGISPPFAVMALHLLGVIFLASFLKRLKL